MSSTLKIIIWGYPTNAHTHFYTHEALYKAFKHLGYDTYWFHDDGYPEDLIGMTVYSGQKDGQIRTYH